MTDGTSSPAARDRITLLILSVGSLLGQNILDCLESRREAVRVIGTNSEPDNPRVFRCDVAYLVTRVEAEHELETQVLEIIRREQPDLILPGRDDDVVFLARLRERHPSLAARIPCGSSKMAAVMRDKALSHEFAAAHSLPFAATFVVPEQNAAAALEAWLHVHPLPLLAKPRAGFGSRGIRLIYTREQLGLALEQPGTVLQEFIGRPPDLTAIEDVWRSGVPWFFSIPETAQYAGQTVISPAGEVGEIFCSVNTMVLGRCERSQRIEEPEFVRLTCAFAEAFAAAGWRGPANFQFKRHTDETYLAHEFNGRMTGSTSARLLMGFDEIALVVQRFLGRQLRPVAMPATTLGDSVHRTLTDLPLLQSEVARLRNYGCWERDFPSLPNIS
jgi:carbamoyl-phosphate synthase large subunit